MTAKFLADARRTLLFTVGAMAWIGAVAAAEPVKIVALGTSLTAGYGLAPQDAPPALLEAKLKAMGYDVTVENAGVSGDTSAGGRARLDWALSGDPEIVIVELGGNDVLRGLDPAETRRNLDAILGALHERGIDTLVAGMVAAPNLGADYASEFNAIYPELAARYGDALYPFILEGVAADPALNQEDGIHPNPEGAAILAAGLAQAVLPLVQKHAVARTD